VKVQFHALSSDTRCRQVVREVQSSYLLLGLRQQSFLVLGPMTIIFSFQNYLCVLKWGLLFDERIEVWVLLSTTTVSDQLQIPVNLLLEKHS
jgi:hypothetical protein